MSLHYFHSVLDLKVRWGKLPNSGFPNACLKQKKTLYPNQLIPTAGKKNGCAPCIPWMRLHDAERRFIGLWCKTSNRVPDLPTPCHRVIAFQKRRCTMARLAPPYKPGERLQITPRKRGGGGRGKRREWMGLVVGVLKFSESGFLTPRFIAERN